MSIDTLNIIAKRLLFISLIVLTLPVIANPDTGQTDRAEITHLLDRYQQALNGGHTSHIVPLYTNDGVFMPANKPTATGTHQIKTAYQHVFQALDLNVKFHIDEIEQHGDMAFLRTTSDGKIKLLEKEITIKNNSRELFILKKNNDQWKIYRYMFNEVNSESGRYTATNH